MEAQTLNCPMCGASQATDATKCDHCGARLATVACPSCFGLIFQGAKFCSHCGAKVDRTELDPTAKRPCPHCKIQMDAAKVGSVDLLECHKCEGLWIDNATFKDICLNSEMQSAVLGMPMTIVTGENTGFENFRYVPCPVCKTLMNRVNFANCSHVIVDVCAKHGTWFDREELRKVVEFIRSGGLEKSRAREIEELQRQRALARDTRTAGGGSMGEMPTGSARYDGYEIAFDVLGSALKAMFKL